MSLGADLAKAHGEQLRLAALQLLGELPGYRASDAVLHPALEAMGLPCTRDQLRGHLAWLGEQQLVRLEASGTVAIATLLERGADVARGHALVPGVARPTPER